MNTALETSAALHAAEKHTAYRLSPQEIDFSIPESKIAELKQKAVQKPLVGQERAISALQLGLNINTAGYNIFIMGAPGTGRQTVLSELLKDYKPNKTELQDIAYVHNYRRHLEPAALFFPAGEGRKFKKTLKHTIEAIYKNAVKIEKSEAFLSSQKKIVSAADIEENTLFADFELKMLSRGFKLLQIKDNENQSIDLVPIIKGKEVSFPELQLRVARKKFSEKKLQEMQDEYYRSLDEMVELFSYLRKQRDEADAALKKKYTELLEPIVTEELKAVHNLVDNYPADTEKQKKHQEKIRYFLKKTAADLITRASAYTQPFKSNRHKKIFFGKYEVNLICEHTDDSSYVVHETVPSFSNLFGTIESQTDSDGSLVNGHAHIRRGAVHRALGGVLILRLNDLFEEEDSWVYLKRVLQSGKIGIQASGSGSQTPSVFKPEPIPAQLKVIIIGGQYSYEILYQEDPDFYKLFKVCAEFDSALPCTDENLAAVLALITSFEKKHGGLPFTDAGYAQLLTYAVQLSGCRHLISAQFTKLADFVTEAQVIAKQNKAKAITADSIKKTIEHRRFLSARPEEKFAEMVQLKELLIDTTGTAVGKLNGLAVEERGFHSFGIPVSITAQASAGTNGIINIEREAGLSGEIYDKAHLIISSLLRQKYAQDFPLSISAAICFEQSYGMVDGDSASCAEFLSLISAIGKIPLRQDIAVTGSLNQLGKVQPVGGISEKITGFFDTCALSGLTGTQGVMIPQTNYNNLFLPERVQQAIADNTFSIWTINTIDQGIALLTSLDEKESTAKISAVLKQFAEQVKFFKK